MEPLTNLETVKLMWPGCTSHSDERIELYIDKASAFIYGELAKANVTIDQDDDIQASNLETVCIALMRRVMDVDTNNAGYGVTNLNQSAGGYQISQTFSNPLGSWYLEKGEKMALGIIHRGVYCVKAALDA